MCDHIGGNRRPTTAGREQVFEQLIGKQLTPVIGEEGVYRVRLHQVRRQNSSASSNWRSDREEPCIHQFFPTSAGNANRVDCSAGSLLAVPPEVMRQRSNPFRGPCPSPFRVVRST